MAGWCAVNEQKGAGGILISLPLVQSLGVWTSNNGTK